MSLRIPYVNLGQQHRPLREELLKAIDEVLQSGQFILGEETEKFEREFAALCQVRFAVGVNSGTDALILALKCRWPGRSYYSAEFYLASQLYRLAGAANVRRCGGFEY
jgi:acetylornithine/succinyldiaminopimelate/putrescine aminotransferase